MNGWHHFESLGLRKSDRRVMYISLGEGYLRDWEALRYLGVATPLLAFYAAKHYLASENRSRDMFERILTVELLQNSVLSFLRAAHVGLPYQILSDHRHYRDWGPNPGRLFRLGSCTSNYRVINTRSSSSKNRDMMQRVGSWFYVDLSSSSGTVGSLKVRRTIGRTARCVAFCLTYRPWVKAI